MGARFSVVALAVLVLAVVAPAARGQGTGKASILREADTVVVDDKGDGVYTGLVTFPTEGIYDQVKQNFPNPNVLLRNVLGSKGKVEMTNATVGYDDAKRSLHLSATILGAAVAKHNKWQMDVGKNVELLHVDSHTAILLSVANMDGASLVVSGKVELPTGAKNIKIEADTGSLVYDLDRETKKGDVSLEAVLKAKPRIMSALYKIYGDSDYSNGTFWTAKTIFTNSGVGDITHLKVSYRMGEYAAWSPQTEYSLIAPGGHIVDMYYPLMSKDTAELKSKTPVDLEVKFSYSDASGKEYSDNSSKRVTLLGANGFEYSNVADEERTNAWSDNFSNTPLVAAFVTSMDDPVRAFGGMVEQACGGQPANHDDESAVRFCKALYDLEVANGIAYQSAVGLLTDNGGVSQELKYPRDVLRDKSGTCIELSILYAATCQTVGLQCNLVMIPGHCYVLVQLPGGGEFPVECTAISGPAIPVAPNAPKHPQPYTFAESAKFAQYEISKLEMGKFFIVNVKDLQGQGVLCPELSKLPADILNSWGYKLGPAQTAPRTAAPDAEANANNDNGGNGGNANANGDTQIWRDRRGRMSLAVPGNWVSNTISPGLRQTFPGYALSTSDPKTQATIQVVFFDGATNSDMVAKKIAQSFGLRITLGPEQNDKVGGRDVLILPVSVIMFNGNKLGLLIYVAKVNGGLVAIDAGGPQVIMKDITPTLQKAIESVRFAD